MEQSSVRTEGVRANVPERVGGWDLTLAGGAALAVLALTIGLAAVGAKAAGNSDPEVRRDPIIVLPISHRR